MSVPTLATDCRMCVERTSNCLTKLEHASREKERKIGMRTFFFYCVAANIDRMQKGEFNFVPLNSTSLKYHILLTAPYGSDYHFLGTTFFRPPCAQPKICVLSDSAFVLFMGFRSGQMRRPDTSHRLCIGFIVSIQFSPANYYYFNPQHKLPCPRRIHRVHDLCLLWRIRINFNGRPVSAKMEDDVNVAHQITEKFSLFHSPCAERRFRCRWVSSIQTLFGSRQAIVVCNSVFLSSIALQRARLHANPFYCGQRPLCFCIYFVRV